MTATHGRIWHEIARDLHARGFTVDEIERLMTLTEIDEYLTLANEVPTPQRGSAWHAHVDALLEQRAALTRS